MHWKQAKTKKRREDEPSDNTHKIVGSITVEHT